MKIQLPNGQKSILDDSISLEEKVKIVEDLTEEWMTVIKLNWDSNSVKFFLDSLANYLVWHKEEEDTSHDKEVMSRNKTNRLLRGRKDIPFSNLSSKDVILLFGERGAE
ncbi:hypothetical protein PQE75_gp105 [Bacillus phage vB_BcoS-136]|uniref:Uncharacterized protein n=1 Tax=Bacillus phage vB_BcoS-136 TaxID=2419619 RepID=A0A3G3BVG0_9CAUD|nr:hypothetical protein PQE75_gp105 [Bacillus phage vB_BcoS-136]AYP68237.1 hypothetical protein vBBcoS136_00105 [Bacillus phage vB_BcoS-136]